MYKQTEVSEKQVKMGNGDGSIYTYGCYLTSLCNGLNRFGWNFTPDSLNEFFGSDGKNRPVKLPNAWIGPSKNYIDVLNLHKYFPEIFTGFQQIDPWNDVPLIQSLIKPNRVILGRVSAVPIGGTGDHFVLVVDIQDNVVVIHDPWTGKTEKITVRWSKYGNILGLRIFDILPYKEPEPVEPPVTDKTLLDLSPIGTEPDGTPYKIENFATVKAKIKAKDQAIVSLQSQVSDLTKKNSKLDEDLTTAQDAFVACNKELTDTQEDLVKCQNSHEPTPSKVPAWLRRIFGDNV